MAKRTASAKKQARAGARRAVRNRSVKSAVKTRVTRARRAVAEHDVDAAREIGLAAVSGLDRAAEKGILHPNNAARRKSRLMKLLNSVVAAEPEAATAAKRSAKKATPAKKAAPAKPAAPAAKGAPAKKATAKPAAAKKTPAKKK